MALDDIDDNIDDGTDSLNQFGRETAFIIDAFTTLGEVIQRSMGEAISSANDMDDIGRSIATTYKKDILKNIKGVVSGLDTQLAIEQKIAEGADVTAEIGKLQEQLEAKKLAIKARMNLLQNSGVALSDEEKLALEEQVQLQEQLISDLQTRNEENAKAAQEAKKASGATGAAVAGFDSILKSFDKSGNLSDRLNLGEASAAAEEYAAGILAAGGNVNSLGSQLGILGKLGGGVFKQLLTAFKPIDLIVTAITLVVDAFVKLDESSGKFAKNFGVAYNQVLPLQRSFNEIANDSGSIAVTTAGVGEAFQKLNDRLGTFGELSEETLTTFADLSARTILTDEALGNISEVARLIGKDMEDVTAEMVGQVAVLNTQNGLSLNQRQLLEETEGISAQLLLNLKQNPKELVKAVYQAKQFGISLAQAEQISGRLLDFQSSIEQELEAELLTGKQLNLEQARYLALTGQSADAAAEVLKQVGSAAEFGNMNVLAQEALANAVGLTTNELANSLRQQELIQQIGESNTAAAQAYKQALAEGKSEAEARLAAEKEGYSELTSGLSVQEKFTLAVAKLQEAFVSIALPILDITAPLIDLASNVLPMIATILQPISTMFEGISKIISGDFKGLTFWQATLGGIATVMGTVYGLSKGILALTKLQNAQVGYQLAREEGMNVLRAIGVGLEETKLGVMFMQGAALVKNAALMVGNILKSIADLAISAAASVAKIPFIGPILAVAAAAGAAALGYRYLAKADDLYMPPEGGQQAGYGDRTLLGPEGAIALNNKDTVIAGTNLFPSPSPQENNTALNTQTLNTEPAQSLAEPPVINVQPNIEIPPSIVNVTVPPVNVPQPNVEVPAPVVNVPPSIVNVPQPNVEVPTPIVNVPQPNVEVPAPVVNMPQPNVEVPAPVVNVPQPNVEVPAPVVNVPQPNVEVPVPVIDTSVIPINVPQPNVEVPTPVVNVPQPNVEVPTPLVNVPSPVIPQTNVSASLPLLDTPVTSNVINPNINVTAPPTQNFLPKILPTSPFVDNITSPNLENLPSIVNINPTPNLTDNSLLPVNNNFQPNLTTSPIVNTETPTPTITPIAPSPIIPPIETQPTQTSTSSKVNVESKVDLSPLEKQMAKVAKLLEDLNNKEGDVILDGTKVGTTLNVGSYKLQ